MTNQFIQPLSVDFDHDWSRINSMYNELIKMIGENKFQSYSAGEYKATVYSLGHLGGCMIKNTSLTKPNIWYIWSGELLEKLLPAEILAWKQRLLNAGLEFVNFSYTVHQGNISKHIDGKAEGEAPNGHCNINYIINTTDPDACTVATDGIITEQYLSVPKSCWLLNTATHHQVNSMGHREVFQIKVHSGFAQVQKFFEDLGLANRFASTVDQKKKYIV